MVVLGCGGISQLTGRSFHQKAGWKAKDYFDDPQVIALCHAIEADDLDEIDRLIAAGANVNAKGKDGMTPLFWALPDNKLARFTRLLEHGANPNVAIESDLGTHGSFEPGESVTHMACKTKFPGYFEAVFAHGGDPNLVRNSVMTKKGYTPLFSVITGGGPKKLAHVRTLIEKHADLDHTDSSGSTPVMTAVSWGGQYDIALELLKAGANYKAYLHRRNNRLIHLVVSEVERTPNQPITRMTPRARKLDWTPQQAADFQKLVKWLEDHGESVTDARADIIRWQSWRRLSSGEYRRKMDAEIAERVAREAGEKEAAGAAP